MSKRAREESQIKRMTQSQGLPSGKAQDTISESTRRKTLHAPGSRAAAGPAEPQAARLGETQRAGAVRATSQSQTPAARGIFTRFEKPFADPSPSWVLVLSQGGFDTGLSHPSPPRTRCSSGWKIPRFLGASAGESAQQEPSRCQCRTVFWRHMFAYTSPRHQERAPARSAGLFLSI